LIGVEWGVDSGCPAHTGAGNRIGQHMIQECCVCGCVYGMKAPLQDLSRTSGYCPHCYTLELERIGQELQAERKRTRQNRSSAPGRETSADRA
jgi:hypothetical protein